ncbi:MAG: TlpA family protein disulfide reductase [Acidobacteria bacterium]|nr:TlpA family protein disulfide reductase [Acidobacteriota bacterium]MBI3281519.1 TlpA family protein disulfide reductase [Acidobacteriota bacterium]
MSLLGLRPALLVAGIIVAALAACSSVSEERVRAAVKGEKERKPAPEFALKDADGRAASLRDYRGKVVLLNFWATWCGPCKIEIPWFAEFEQKYKDRGFAVIGISLDEEGWSVVKPYITEMKVNYRMLVGNDSVSELYGGVESLPTTFVIDRQGKIASAHVGLVSKSVYENEIRHLLDSVGGRTGAGERSRRAD